MWEAHTLALRCNTLSEAQSYGTFLQCRAMWHTHRTQRYVKHSEVPYCVTRSRKGSLMWPTPKRSALWHTPTTQRYVERSQKCIAE
ncbi:hypothetical protein NDU88_000832 [Pleurodeles waltl]|uniref:Uncharacterized protein n=1 Tax=Pleurodeles waltl TaxID=8319 RepID=A0AAV7M1C0_PLEWA|nr:hypothetical protein NDU88_000832 [Pleurodeles waltl]